MTYVRPSLDDWNRDNPLTADGSGVYSGWRSPMEQDFGSAPMTDEQYALLLNGKVARKTRAVRTAADIQRAQDEAAFLDSIGSGDTAGIYDPAGDPRQARLQELLNRDYMARARGANLSMQGIRRNEAMARADRPYNLAVAQFNAGKKDREQNRKLKQQQIDAMEEYRKNRLALDDQRLQSSNDIQSQRFERQDQSFANRVENQNANRKFKEDQAGKTNTRADANQVRNLFIDAVNAERNGANTSELDAAFTSLFPRLDPAQQQVAMGIMAKRSNESQVANLQADRYNALLLSRMRDARTRGGDPSLAVQAVEDAWTKDPTARRSTVFDPQTGKFIPHPRYSSASALGSTAGIAPEDQGFADSFGFPEEMDQATAPTIAPRSQYREGALLRGQDGFLYRVVNGQPQRTNLRR